MAEIRLEVYAALEGGLCRMRFRYGKSYCAHLCLLVHPAVQPLPEGMPKRYGAATAWLYGLFFGVRGLVPLSGFWSSMENENSIRFDACEDRRRGLPMVLVSASDKGEGGGVFRITRENYEEVMGRLRAWGEELAR